MSRRIALLRGVNVGGYNRLAMEQFRLLLAELGAERVSTWIQSGNAVYDAPEESGAADPETISHVLERRAGVRSPVVLRTAAELETALRDWPWPEAEPNERSVMFLASQPDPERVAALDPQRSPPDRFEVLGREIYLRFPDGIARSKLTNAWFDRQLDTVSTSRNWRTLTKLLELARSGAEVAG